MQTGYISFCDSTAFNIKSGNVKQDIIRPFDGQVVFFDTLYKQVQKVTVTDAGSGYTTAPTVTIAAPSESWGIRRY